MKKLLLSTLTIACVVLMAAPVLLAGEPEEPKPPTQDTPQDGAQGEEAPPAEAAPVYFSQDHASYTVQLAGDAEPANLLLTVVPKPGFKVNVAYPWKFTQGESTLKKDAFQLTEKLSTLQLAETSPEGLTGVLRFSVCNETACLVEKVEIAAAAPAEDAAPQE